MSDKELVKKEPKREGFLVAGNLKEAREIAELIGTTSFLPKSYVDSQNRPKINDIILAGSLGLRHGLDMFQSVQAICVINKRPCMWGDYLIAIVQRHPLIEDIVETFDDDTMTASCTIKRVGRTTQTRTFSKEDAEKSGLWSDPTKKHTWGKYPKRMLQMRARGFCCRDVASDILQGISLAEEAQDIIDVQVINEAKKMIAAGNFKPGQFTNGKTSPPEEINETPPSEEPKDKDIVEAAKECKDHGVYYEQDECPGCLANKKADENKPTPGTQKETSKEKSTPPPKKTKEKKKASSKKEEKESPETIRSRVAKFIGENEPLHDELATRFHDYMEEKGVEINNIAALFNVEWLQNPDFVLDKHIIAMDEVLNKDGFYK